MNHTPRAYFDGSCEPVNPGGTAKYGWVLYLPGGRWTCSGTVGSGAGMTNNVAEYAGLESLLKFLVERGFQNVPIYGDSKMVVNMVSGRWGRKKPHKKVLHLLPYYDSCRSAFKASLSTLAWVPREQNEEADALSNADGDGNAQYHADQPVSSAV